MWSIYSSVYPINWRCISRLRYRKMQIKIQCLESIWSIYSSVYHCISRLRYRKMQIKIQGLDTNKGRERNWIIINCEWDFQCKNGCWYTYINTYIIFYLKKKMVEHWADEPEAQSTIHTADEHWQKCTSYKFLKESPNYI